jgi:hypothetical protein
MWSRFICVAAVCVGLAPQAQAGGQSGIFHRASCTVVRFYVAKYSAPAAELGRAVIFASYQYV